MASSESDSAAASFLEQLINHRNRDLSFFLPLILGFSNSSPTESDTSDQDQESDSNRSERARGRIVLINPSTQGMIVIETSRNLEDMFSEFTAKEGRKPASKASIEAMPTVVVMEKEKECAICLDGLEIEGEAKEMPCKHLYHSKCIEKWLNVHGTCPVCRYEMPVDESKDSDHGEGGSRGGREEIWVRFSVSGRRGSTDGLDDENASSNNTEE